MVQMNIDSVKVIKDSKLNLINCFEHFVKSRHADATIPIFFL